MPDRSGPADTVMMVIMHDALRRDFARARSALTGGTAPRNAQRVALAKHIAFMLAFLHEHHHSEDEKLWPTVRALDPGLAELLEAMSGDHAAIAAETDQLTAAAERYLGDGGDTARATLVNALDRLTSCLLPHLDREESQVLPRIAACMTNDQWHAFEKAAMPPFSKRVLAEYFNWFLDELDEPRRRQAMKALPAPIVFLMTRVYGPGYRRRAAVRWAPSISAAKATRTTVREG